MPIEPLGPDPTDVHVGERLRALRKRAGVSQGHLASTMGITFQQIQKYERGDNRMSASKLLVAARVLGVRVSDFFQGLEPEGALPSPALLDPGLEEVARQLAALKNPRARAQIAALIAVLEQD